MSREAVEYYLDEARSHLAKNDEIAELQKLASQSFSTQGFPTRQNEDWKYVSLTNFLEHRFKVNLAKQPRLCEEYATKQSSWIVSPSARSDEIAFASNTYQINILNGQVLDLVEPLPKGLEIHSLSSMMSSQPQKIVEFLQQNSSPAQTFIDLNTLFLSEGVWIEIKPGVIVDKPICLRYLQNQSNNAAHTRNLIKLHENASVTIMQIFDGSAEISYFTNTYTQIDLGFQSNLVHYILQCESNKSFHVAKTTVHQKQASSFANHLLQYGGELARNDISIKLLEPEALCYLNGIYTPKTNQQMDQVIKVEHLAPHCQSRQNYKGVIADSARAVFNGSVYVANEAQKTRAEQSNQNILLSKLAEINTKPQLDIFADDVVCSHGATVGYLDKESLFYLQARGLSLLKAKQYLIRGFLNTNIRDIPHQGFRNKVENLLGDTNE